MTAKECIEGRRSIRQFTDQPVDRAIISDIVSTASYAPSWKNTQIVRYIAIDDKATKDRIANEGVTIFPGNASRINSAPVLIAVTAIKGRCGFERDGSYSTVRGDSWQMFDAGVACEAFCLSAYEHGLGTVILGLFDIDTVSSILNIPDDRELIALIPMGYPNESPEAPKRKTVEDLLSFC